MAGQGEPKEPEEAKLTEAKKARLEAEYRECSEDWRLRDKYVLDKLPAAGILFGLLGVALGTLPPETHLIKVLLVLIGGLFSIVLSISVAKDTYYRDGTEKLLRHLSARLGINNSLQTLKSLEDFEDLQFTRKIKIKRDRYSLRLPSTASNNNYIIRSISHFVFSSPNYYRLSFIFRSKHVFPHPDISAFGEVLTQMFFPNKLEKSLVYIKSAHYGLIFLDNGAIIHYHALS